VKVRKPSLLFKLLQWSVRSGRLRKGYGRLLDVFPNFLWGGEDILTKTDVGEMLLPLNDPGSTGLMLFGKILHEVRESAFIKNLSASCQVVFDIGANVGWYSCMMWNEMKDKKEIYAFEPNPYVYPYLHHNSADKEGIITENLAVGEMTHLTTIYCNKSSNLSSTTRQVGKSVLIQEVSLDDYSQSRNIDWIDFIKCDVEGGELFVLRGARRIRGVPDPPIWMIEIDNSFIRDIGHNLEEIIDEVNSIDRTVKFFIIDNNIIRQTDLLESRNCQPNVFIVPSTRLLQFKQSALVAGIEME
jgi:FkbM family methyltransferase